MSSAFLETQFVRRVNRGMLLADHRRIVPTSHVVICDICEPHSQPFVDFSGYLSLRRIVTFGFKGLPAMAPKKDSPAA